MPAIRGAKGLLVEVTWFRDKAQNDDNRVVRLRALPQPQTPSQGVTQ